ncbi:MAG TPA: hypothetical protein VMW87_14675 [Spirochaetia bacterium]|nr:hypothetical protein [Spirochaetia bacterium]
MKRVKQGSNAGPGTLLSNHNQLPGSAANAAAPAPGAAITLPNDNL